MFLFPFFLAMLPFMLVMPIPAKRDKTSKPE
jgi:hypothetical protein